MYSLIVLWELEVVKFYSRSFIICKSIISKESKVTESVIHYFQANKLFCIEHYSQSCVSIIMLKEKEENIILLVIKLCEQWLSIMFSFEIFRFIFLLHLLYNPSCFVIENKGTCNPLISENELFYWLARKVRSNF